MKEKTKNTTLSKIIDTGQMDTPNMQKRDGAISWYRDFKKW